MRLTPNLLQSIGKKQTKISAKPENNGTIRWLPVGTDRRLKKKKTKALNEWNQGLITKNGEKSRQGKDSFTSWKKEECFRWEFESRALSNRAFQGGETHPAMAPFFELLQFLALFSAFWFWFWFSPDDVGVSCANS